MYYMDICLRRCLSWSLSWIVFRIGMTWEKPTVHHSCCVDIPYKCSQIIVSWLHAFLLSQIFFHVHRMNEDEFNLSHNC